MRPCIERDCNALTQRTRCLVHERQYDRDRMGRRGDLYGATHRKRSKEAIADEPWCHWPGCMSTVDLTADHIQDGNPDSEYQVLCRGHNAVKANRRRAGSAIRFVD